MKAFLIADGTKLLIETLLQSLQSSDANSTSATSTTSLLVSVLRSTVSQTDLPFLEYIKDRVFPLPTPDLLVGLSNNNVTDGDTNCAVKRKIVLETDLTYESIADSYCEIIKQGKGSDNSEDKITEIVKTKLIDLCPEIAEAYGIKHANSIQPTGNIRVRHVQPMLVGKHIVCRNTLMTENEPQLRRSSANQK
jgi:hypothetical protein